MYHGLQWRCSLVDFSPEILRRLVQASLQRLPLTLGLLSSALHRHQGLLGDWVLLVVAVTCSRAVWRLVVAGSMTLRAAALSVCVVMTSCVLAQWAVKLQLLAERRDGCRRLAAS